MPAWASVCWLVVVGSATPADNTSPVVEAVIAHASSCPDGTAPFTFAPADLRGETRNLPIGIFDSGIGGLTVLEAILAVDAFDNRSLKPGADGRPDFEDERFVYLGDQANMPYGNYPREGNETYLRELILKDAVFLLGRRFWPAADATAAVFDKPPVKAIVIACNTATAYGLEDVRAAISRWGIPVVVVGVVEAGARGVLEAHGTDGRNDAIAVLATVGTCDSMAYPKAIGAAFGRSGRRGPMVVQRGFKDLPAAIEGDPAVLRRTTVDEAIVADLRALLEAHRSSGGTAPIGSIVLGCTHFPLVRDHILTALERLREEEEAGSRPFARLLAPRIDVIDPADLAARELFRTLALARLRAREQTVGEQAARDGPPPGRSVLYFISVPADQPSGCATWSDAKFHRATGRLDVEDTRVVPLRPAMLPATSLDMIRTRLPNVSQSLGW